VYPVYERNNNNNNVHRTATLCQERDIGLKHAESVYHYTDAVARDCPATGVRLVRQASFYLD